jgi:hypothetical protein
MITSSFYLDNFEAVIKLGNYIVDGCKIKIFS